MANDLVILEQQLTPLAPRFEDVLQGTGLPVAKLMQTVLVSCEINPTLLEGVFRPTLLRGAMTAACLGLEVDGVSGQGFLLPFKGRAPTVQFITGYRGFPTIAARSQVTMNMGVIREGDDYDFQLGSGGYIKVKPKLGKESERPIIATWATASHHDRPDVIEVLSIDQIMLVKGKSMGAKKASSPWNDPLIGFPAMAAKTALRRCAKLVPVRGLQLASRMEEAFEEQNLTSGITPDKGLVLDGEVVDETPAEDEAPRATTQERLHPPKLIFYKASGTSVDCPDADAWTARIVRGMTATKTTADLDGIRMRHDPLMVEMRNHGMDDHVDEVEEVFKRHRETL